MSSRYYDDDEDDFDLETRDAISGSQYRPDFTPNPDAVNPTAFKDIYKKIIANPNTEVKRGVFKPTLPSQSSDSCKYRTGGKRKSHRKRVQKRKKSRKNKSKRKTKSRK